MSSDSAIVDTLVEALELEYTQGAEGIWKRAFLANFVFGFDSYDSYLDSLFTEKALELCRFISKDPESRGPNPFTCTDESAIQYYLLLKFPFFAETLEYGTSPRYPWWVKTAKITLEFPSSGQPSISIGVKYLVEAMHKFLGLAYIRTKELS